jgi:hypothetical protein
MSEVSILPGRERRRKWTDGEKLSIVEDDVSANYVFGLAVEKLRSAARTFNRVVQVWLMAWFITSAVSIVMAIVIVCDAHDRPVATATIATVCIQRRASPLSPSQAEALLIAKNSIRVQREQSHHAHAWATTHRPPCRALMMGPPGRVCDCPVVAAKYFRCENDIVHRCKFDGVG